jgi:hypothetical protein
MRMCFRNITKLPSLSFSKKNTKKKIKHLSNFKNNIATDTTPENNIINNHGDDNNSCNTVVNNVNTNDLEDANNNNNNHTVRDNTETKSDRVYDDNSSDSDKVKCNAPPNNDNNNEGVETVPSEESKREISVNNVSEKNSNDDDDDDNNDNDNNIIFNESNLIEVKEVTPEVTSNQSTDASNTQRNSNNKKKPKHHRNKQPQNAPSLPTPSAKKRKDKSKNTKHSKHHKTKINKNACADGETKTPTHRNNRELVKLLKSITKQRAALQHYLDDFVNDRISHNAFPLAEFLSVDVPLIKGGKLNDLSSTPEDLLIHLETKESDPTNEKPIFNTSYEQYFDANYHSDDDDDDIAYPNTDGGATLNQTDNVIPANSSEIKTYEEDKNQQLHERHSESLVIQREHMNDSDSYSFKTNYDDYERESEELKCSKEIN